MKPFLIILFIVTVSFIAYAAFPSNENIATLNTDEVDGNFNDFHFYWVNGNEQLFTLSFTNRDGYVDLTNYTVKATVENRTGTVASVSSITTSTYIATFTIPRTDVPNAGEYQMEVFAYEGVASNSTKTLAQGRVSVGKSLF